METALYPPIKRFLEARGFRVKGEVGGCDIVAVADDASALLVICELKLAFTLELLLQAIDRADACDEVWLAVRAATRGRERDARVRKLCRRLGFGLLSVTSAGSVELLVSPDAPVPRKNTKRRSRLMAEHRRRVGDPTAGGSTRKPIMTAYRQQALLCAAAMMADPRRPRDLKATIPDAPKILQGNVYGWFSRVERGVYGLTAAGRAALARWPQVRP